MGCVVCTFVDYMAGMKRRDDMAGGVARAIVFGRACRESTTMEMCRDCTMAMNDAREAINRVVDEQNRLHRESQGRTT